MTNPGVCYCGAYGGGVHTKSARCNVPGPKQPPRIHGEGCICGDYTLPHCPVKDRKPPARELPPSKELDYPPKFSEYEAEWSKRGYEPHIATLLAKADWSEDMINWQEDEINRLHNEIEAGGSRERGTSPNRSCGTAGQSGPVSSLLEGLRHNECKGENDPCLQEMCGDADDEIERLQRANAELLKRNVILSSSHEPSPGQWRVVCAKCGKSPRVDLGQDLRFPGDPRQSAYRAQCSGVCLEPTFSRRTHDDALEVWNRHQIASGAPFPRASQPPGPGWQPIETAPKDGTLILLAANTHNPNGKPRISSGHYSTDPYIGGPNDDVIGAEEGFKGDGDECIPSNQECFTHWAPIPAFTLTKGAG